MPITRRVATGPCRRHAVSILDVEPRPGWPAFLMLTNTVRPDIFTPGNHEYDFGKPVFLERAMRRAGMTAL
jgi:hypothetical protein